MGHTTPGNEDWPALHEQASPELAEQLALLLEMANTTRYLHAEYPRDAARLREAEETLRVFRQGGTAEDVRDAAHSYRSIRQLCVESQHRLFALERLVSERFPVLWPELRIIGANANWHGNPQFDWDEAIRELRMIEAAIRVALADLTAEIRRRTSPPVADPNAPAAGDPSRRTPSDCRPTSFADRIRARQLGRLIFPDGVQAAVGTTAGPHYRALIEYLKAFDGTPHERTAWNIYYDWSRPKPDEVPLLEQQAAQEGLSLEEWIARETLAELRRYFRSNEIAEPLLPADGAATQLDAPIQPKTEHSTDFRSVLWFGIAYSFTGTQASCVRLLWQEWERGTPDVGEATVLEAADSTQRRLIGLFGNGKHPAWGTMIRPGATKGTYRLVAPDAEN